MSESMFPAPAGMSPIGGHVKTATVNVPRTRGDEPVMHQLNYDKNGCSPHPRG